MLRLFMISIFISTQFCIQCDAADTQIAVQLKPRTTLQTQISHTLSAVGICWRTENHQIYYVDPQSDAYNRIFQGDIIISEDGMSPEQFRSQGYFLNDINTPVQIVVIHAGQTLQITTYRRPVAQFSAAWHQGSKY